jgi:hypothetical protein
MSSRDPVGISLRPPSGVAAPEFGPLVRAQPVPGAFDSPGWWIGSTAGILWASLLLGSVFPGLPNGFLLAPMAAGPWLARSARRLWQRRRMRRCRSWDGAGPPPPGATRVTGRVRGLGEAFLPPGERQPVVYVRTRFWQATGTGRPAGPAREDVRGVFLEIELDGEEAVRVAPEAVFLMGGESVVPELGPQVRWKLGAPWAGPLKGRLRRGKLREGDRVEAVGEVVREVNTQGAASPGRGVPMIQWLVPAWNGGVWIRKLDAS